MHMSPVEAADTVWSTSVRMFNPQLFTLTFLEDGHRDGDQCYATPQDDNEAVDDRGGDCGADLGLRRLESAS
jgi:hypothetical protein